jgi:hypothetical protein
VVNGLAGRRLLCAAGGGEVFGAHLELFAGGHVVAIPAGIGVSPPEQRNGAQVAAGRCSYPLRTREPTGVIEVRAGAPLTLGDFFSIWHQPLSTHRLAGFRVGPRSAVRAYVDGRRWGRDVRLIPFGRHAQIVLEAGPYLSPHPSYGFPPGL